MARDLPPLPAGGPEAPRIDAVSEASTPDPPAAQTTSPRTTKQAASTPKASTSRPTPPPKPTTARSRAVAERRRRQSIRAKKRAKSQQSLRSKLTRRTGRTSRGKQGYGYRDPISYAIFFALLAPVIVAGVIVASGQNSDVELATDGPSVDSQATAIPVTATAPARVASDNGPPDDTASSETARRGPLPACDELLPSLGDQEQPVAVKGRPIGFDTAVTIRTGDPATTWTIQVCNPRNVMHEFESYRYPGYPLPDVVELPTIELGLVVRLDDAPGDATEAEVHAAFAWGWDFSTPELDSHWVKQPWFCGYLTWDQRAPDVFGARTLVEGEIAAGAACTVVHQEIDFDDARGFIEFDDGIVEFSSDGLNQSGLLADLTGE